MDEIEVLTPARRYSQLEAPIRTRVTSDEHGWVTSAEPRSEDVIAFVASQRGAVGYVSLAAQVPETVREVTVQ